MISPYQVVKDFESALCEYTGSKFAVTTTSCTMALLLACRWQYESSICYSSNPGDYIVTIPKHTYVGVPMSIIHAGFKVAFEEDEEVLWEGGYQLEPLPVWDYARLFTRGIHAEGDFTCVSFHWSKHLAIGQGGAILHDSDEADEWFRMMRFDGRKEGVAPSEQKDWVLGYHAYMSPRDAAEGLSRLSVLPEHNEPLPNDSYPDLSKIEVFK
jgi:dTDP-4-amino-4,6-dideoxygalactose transaminase